MFFFTFSVPFYLLFFFFRTRPAFLLWPTTSLTTSCTRVIAPVSRVWSAVGWLWTKPSTPWSTTTPAVSPRNPRDTPISPTFSVWSSNKIKFFVPWTSSFQCLFYPCTRIKKNALLHIICFIWRNQNYNQNTQ